MRVDWSMAGGPGPAPPERVARAARGAVWGGVALIWVAAAGVGPAVAQQGGRNVAAGGVQRAGDPSGPSRGWEPTISVVPGRGLDGVLVARWAAPGLSVAAGTPADGAAAAGIAVVGGWTWASLALLLAAAGVSGAVPTFRRRHEAGAARTGDVPRSAADHETRCRALMQSASILRGKAEAAVFDMDPALPLRSLLFSELRQISERLAAEARTHTSEASVLSVLQAPEYWRAFGRSVQQCVRDLQRISDLAEAAHASFGDRSLEPRMPKTLTEAYFVLGANAHVDHATLQRLVKALRQCWHPDLAQIEQDRHYREARLKQINVAFDLIRGRRAAG